MASPIDTYLGYLRGCTEGVAFTKENAQKAVVVLSTCDAHNGAHHFAVVDDGKTVLCSKTGIECLEEVGLLHEN